MGIFLSCCRGDSAEFTTPDAETRRRQQAEAAERRLQEQEHRGIKDPEKFRRAQQKQEQLEKLEAKGLSSNNAPLKWQMS